MNKYKIEETNQMSAEEFDAMLEESNRYVEEKMSMRKEEKIPEFNRIEECLEYYNAVPFDEAMKYLNSLFEDYDCL